MDDTGITLLSVSVGLTLVALLVQYWDRRFQARALRASGTVIGYRVETDRQERDGEVTCSDLHRPIFRYRDADGVEREALSQSANSPAPYGQGAVVPILYDPARPDVAIAEHDALLSRRVPPLLGLLAVAAGAFALLRAAFVG